MRIDMSELKSVEVQYIGNTRAVSCKMNCRKEKKKKTQARQIRYNEVAATKQPR